MLLKALSKRSWEAAVLELFVKSFVEGQNFYHRNCDHD